MRVQYFYETSVILFVIKKINTQRCKTQKKKEKRKRDFYSVYPPSYLLAW